MSPEDIPADLKAILDKAAGKEHSAEGPVMACLAEILTAHGAMVSSRVPGTSPVPEVPESGTSLRAEVAAAIRAAVRLRIGPTALTVAEDGNTLLLPLGEAETAADAALAVMAAEVEELRTAHRKTLRAAFKESGEWKQRADNAESVLERIWAVVEELPADSLVKSVLVGTLEGKR